MWISTAFVLTLLLGFIYVFFSQVLLKFATINKGNIKENKIKNINKKFIIIIIVIWGLLGVLEITGLRLDYSSGQHSIIPTAIDTDFWGNYRLYYKTTIVESNSSESYYYIEKDREDLVEIISECIKNKKEVVVYYDRWIGFKGLGSPETSPIIKILD